MRLLDRVARLVTRHHAPHCARHCAPWTADTRFIVDARTRITGSHEDGRTVMHLGAGTIWAMNPLGSDVWQGLADGRTAREIGANVAARYGVPVDRAERDVAAFVGRLVALDLIHPEARS